MYSDAFFCIFLCLSIVQITFETHCNNIPTNAKCPPLNFKGTFLSPVILNTKKWTIKSSNCGLSTVRPNLSAQYTLINTGNGILMKTPPGNSQATLTGGLLGSDKYQLQGASYRWAANSDGSAGTIYNGEKFPLEVIILYQNTKFPNITDAAKNQNCCVQLRFLIACSDSSYNSFAEPFFKILERITSPGASAPITFQESVLWPSNVPAAVDSYFMPGTMDPLFVPESFEQPPTVIDVVISKLSLAKISCTTQFNTFFKVKNFNEQSYFTSRVAHPLGSRPIITDQRFLVIPYNSNS